METESHSLSPSRTSASYPVSYPHICTVYTQYLCLLSHYLPISLSLIPISTYLSVSYPHIFISLCLVSPFMPISLSIIHIYAYLSVSNLCFSVSYPFIYIYLILMLFVIRYFFLSPFPPHPFLSLFL